MICCMYCYPFLKHSRAFRPASQGALPFYAGVIAEYAQAPAPAGTRQRNSRSTVALCFAARRAVPPRCQLAPKL